MDETIASEAEAHDTAPSRQRRRRTRSQGTSRSNDRGRGRTRLSIVYFGLAAGWGFVVGTGAIVVGLTFAGQQMSFAPGLAVLIVGAAVMAIAGGIVAALAYRDASNRLG